MAYLNKVPKKNKCFQVQEQKYIGVFNEKIQK